MTRQIKAWYRDPENIVSEIPVTIAFVGCVAILILLCSIL